MLRAIRDFQLGAVSGDDDAAPTGYQQLPIKFVIPLKADGTPGQPLTTSGSHAKRDRGKLFAAPHTGRTVGIKAKLLADNGEYSLGIMRDQKDKAPEKLEAERAKVEKRHGAFIELVRACAEATGEPSVLAVLKFLEGPDKAALVERIAAEIAPDENLTFQVEGSYPMDSDAVRAFWASYVGTAGSGATVDGWNCLICGEAKDAVQSHPVLIKGVPDTQMGGAAVVSANSPAFESYGLSRSENGPVCAACAEGYANGLNRLIADDAHHLRIGSLLMVYWSSGEFNLLGGLTHPEKSLEEVKSMIEGVRKGLRSKVDDQAFYAAVLTGNAGRVVFRDWLETSIGSIKQNIVNYFEAQAMVSYDQAEPFPLGFTSLLSSLFRDIKELQTPPARELTRGLLAVALHGHPMPQQTLQLAIRRNRAEQRVTRPRASMIKLALRSYPAYKETPMTQLDSSSPHQAYQCGRLLSLLEGIQRSAQGQINTTLVDRFYGSASTSPGSVFPRLIQGAQPHLAKIRKHQPGLERHFQTEVGAVLAQISANESFPRILTLPQQGLFALGFYHQKAEDQRRIQANQAAKASRDEAAVQVDVASEA